MSVSGASVFVILQGRAGRGDWICQPDETFTNTAVEHYKQLTWLLAALLGVMI